MSIIICVYNTRHEHLEECLSSLARSTVAGEAEIIVIDDGSDKDYRDIIKRHRVCYRKTKNRGQLSARLYGISVARGDFIAFVDSDDTVSMNYHLPMLEKAEKQAADIVINGWAFHTERTKRVCIRDTTMSKPILAVNDEALLLYTQSQGREHSYYVLWNKIYRRELLGNCRRLLDELKISNMRLTYSEDALINFFCFKHARKVVNVNSGFYFYRIHDGQSISVSAPEILKSQIDSICVSMNVMYNNIENNVYTKQIKQSLRKWTRLMARTHYTIARSIGSSELCEYIRQRYGIAKNKKATARDGAVYSACELLGENYGDIDSALTEIYLAKKETTASYERRAKCISRIIKDMPRRVTFSRCGEFSVPKRRIRIRDKILHNDLVYKFGLLLFKKGSRARAFLKKRL